MLGYGALPVVLSLAIVLSGAPAADAAPADVTCTPTISLTLGENGSIQLAASRDVAGGCRNTEATVEASNDTTGQSLASRHLSMATKDITANLDPQPGGNVVHATIRQYDVIGKIRVNGFAETTLTTPATAPAPPGNLVASAPTTTGLRLTWTPPDSDGGSPISGYHVSQQVGQDPINVSGTEYLATGLQPNTAYTFVVTALNDIGESVGVDVSAVTLPIPPGPVPPSPTKPAASVNPQPLPITPTTSGTNADGSRDRDGNPASVQQRVAASWPAHPALASGQRTRLTARAALRTNAGAQATLHVTFRSPEIAQARITYDKRRRAYFVTTYLRKGQKEGSIIITAYAPATSVGTTAFEAIQSSREFPVRRAVKN